MIPVLDYLPQQTHCHGSIGGQEFSLRGGGAGRPFDGVVKTSLKSETGPIPFPIPLLCPILIMGYPTYSTYHVGAFDLFKLSDGYSYTRHFDFEDGQVLKSEHNVTYHGDHLEGNFRVIPCNLELPELTGGDLTIETFFPLSSGVLGSVFSMAWHTKSGGLFRANVTSEYELSHSVTLPYQQFRFIRFENEFSDDSITQVERLNVIRELDRVNMSVVEKTYNLQI